MHSRLGLHDLTCLLLLVLVVARQAHQQSASVEGTCGLDKREERAKGAKNEHPQRSAKTTIREFVASDQLRVDRSAQNEHPQRSAKTTICEFVASDQLRVDKSAQNEHPQRSAKTTICEFVASDQP